MVSTKSVEIRTLTGAKFAVSLRRQRSTVLDLKRAISEHIHVPLECQVLAYKGKTIDTLSSPLTDYGIGAQSGDFLVLINHKSKARAAQKVKKRLRHHQPGLGSYTSGSPGYFCFESSSLANGSSRSSSPSPPLQSTRLHHSSSHSHSHGSGLHHSHGSSGSKGKIILHGNGSGSPSPSDDEKQSARDQAAQLRLSRLKRRLAHSAASLGRSSERSMDAFKKYPELLQKYRRSGRGSIFSFGSSQSVQPSKPPKLGKVDQVKIDHLKSMGFHQEASKKALQLNRNSIELAISWLIENSSNPDLNTPLSCEEVLRLGGSSRPSLVEQHQELVENLLMDNTNNNVPCESDIKSPLDNQPQRYEIHSQSNNNNDDEDAESEIEDATSMPISGSWMRAMTQDLDSQESNSVRE